jgi:uncharacterized protein
VTRDGALPARAPTVTADDAPFWAAAAQERLVLARCQMCGVAIWYPRPICPDCHSSDVRWESASGRGRLYSFTILYRAGGDWAAHVPYVIAYVELEEGPRVLTNIVGADPDTLKIGDDVRAVFDDAGDTKVLRFIPA